MDVTLYIYDLSNGLARNLSRQITGVQIDAIYHTSLVFGDVEYYFGQGIQQAAPGSTHHGQPIETLHMGRSELPLEVIIEYMDSLAETYTEDSYDLFLKNCNNFTHDLAMFLVGKGIPEHIRNLPETFLDSPFGQMMRPYIDSMARRSAPGRPALPIRGPPAQISVSTNSAGRVHIVKTLKEVEDLLSKAQNSCAVIFFTSSTCPPCKIVYPAYDQLAEEAGDKAVLIKVDINGAYDVSSKYGIRATPTFMTFLKGQKDSEWSGADESRLRGNIRLLLQMAWPPHRHVNLKLPTLQKTIDSYIFYKKLPPLDRLVPKLGPASNEPALKELIAFVREDRSQGSVKPHLPNLPSLATLLQSKFSQLPAEIHFAVIDLMRIALIDPRVSGFFAEERDQVTISALLEGAKDPLSCAYNHQLVMTQLMCNLFTSQLYTNQPLSHETLFNTCTTFATTSLLDSHGNLRVAAASFIYNLVVLNHNERFQGRPDKLTESTQVELVASLLEAIQQETENAESLHGLLLSLGLLLYCAPMEGDVLELCRAMDAGNIVLDKAKIALFASEKLIKEIGAELLEKGLTV